MLTLSHVQLFATHWTVAHKAPLSMGFPRQGYWSGVPFLSPGNLPDPGIEPRSLTSPALTGSFLFLPLAPLGKPMLMHPSCYSEKLFALLAHVMVF